MAKKVTLEETIAKWEEDKSDEHADMSKTVAEMGLACCDARSVTESFSKWSMSLLLVMCRPLNLANWISRLSTELLSSYLFFFIVILSFWWVQIAHNFGRKAFSD